MCFNKVCNNFFCFVILFLCDFFYQLFFHDKFWSWMGYTCIPFRYLSLLLLHHSKFFSVIAWLDYYLTFSPWYWTIIMGLHSGSLFRHFSLDRHFVLFLFLLFILTFLSRRFWNPSKSLKKVTSRKKLIMVTLCCKMMMLKATNSDGWK